MKSPKRLAAVGAGARKGAARVAVPASAKRRLGKSASSAISRKINGTRQTAALRKSSVFSSKTAVSPSFPGPKGALLQLAFAERTAVRGAS